MLTLRIPSEPGDAKVITLPASTGEQTSLGLSQLNPIGEGRAPQSWLEAVPEHITHLIAWTGTLDESLFGRENPMTWLPPGREALDGFLAAITPLLLERGLGLLLRPHCRHVLGDATTARSFMDTLDPNLPVGLALDAASILEPAMCKAGADHCRRTFEILGPIADVVILTGAAPSEESVRPAPLGEGPVPASLLVDLYREHCPAETPVALLDERFDEQCQFLGQLLA